MQRVENGGGTVNEASPWESHFERHNEKEGTFMVRVAGNGFYPQPRKVFDVGTSMS